MSLVGPVNQVRKVDFDNATVVDEVTGAGMTEK